MLIVDTHVHIGRNHYEPVEMLLAQMELNGVSKTVLVQSTATLDNSYVLECKSRFPGRLSVVCRVDVDDPAAPDTLSSLHAAGAETVRLRNFHRSPGNDPLAIWRTAARVGNVGQRGRAGGGFRGNRIRRTGGRFAQPVCDHRAPGRNGHTRYGDFRGNCSDLRGSEQLAAGGEGVQASCAPGAEDGCQRHLALGTTFRPGAPADLAADNHMAQAALGGVVVRRHVRFGHEAEEFLDVALDAPAQPALQS